jgi:aerobic carbon-monoxide dehydrogenase large subunit
MSLPNALIGSPVERIEDLRFLTGRGQYVGDLGIHDALHAVILRSPIAHGRIRKIDAQAARELPGVVAVITAAEIGENVPTIAIRQHNVPEGEFFRQPVIAHDKVRYVGEPVAVVIANDAAIAEDALDLIALEFDELPAVADHMVAARDEILLFEGVRSNLAKVFAARMGDADAAFAAADYTRRERFSVQRHTALPMETRGLFAEWDAPAGRLTLQGATKVIFYNRRALADMLGLAEAAVDLIEVDVGGGFGARGEIYPEDFLIPFAARYVGGRVKWVEDRREHLMAMNHAREMYANVEIACKKDGTVLGLRGRVDVDLGAYVRTNGFTAPRNVVQFMSGPYYIPNIALDAAVFMTSKTPTGTYRGPGRFEASYFCERLFDMAANDLGIDPADFRRRNLLREEQMPYPLARLNVEDGGETECDSGRYGEVLERCLEEFGWQNKIELQGQSIDGRHHGIAVGCFIEGGAGGPRENARMVLEADGSVSVFVGSSALGQGLETILSQIAADALSLPMGRIRLFHGSTTLVSDGSGSFHSRSTVMGGSAILLAAEALHQEIRAAAARRLSCATDDICISDGVASCGAERVDFATLAGLAVERVFHNKKHTYSYGAHAAHVAVDPSTGRVEVLDYLTVEDVGRVINPATLHGQVIGSVVQGLGSVFLEHLQYDENGQLLTGSLADYLLPTSTDFPRIRSVSLGLVPCPNNPLGAKGAGEGGLIAVGGVIGNAIAAALRSLSVEPRDLPVSPPRLWHLIDEARRSSAEHLSRRAVIQ